jgi:hypothetical protein
MNLIKIATLCGWLAAASLGYGQSATLIADTTVVSTGSELTLRPSVVYPGTPNAVGWSITLPDGWSFVATNGPDVPQIGPEPGSTGTLEWAYANVPIGGARFSFKVKAGGAAGSVKLIARVLLRIDGKQQQMDAGPLSISVNQ